MSRIGRWRIKFEAWDAHGNNLGATICFRHAKDALEAKNIARALYRTMYPGKEKLVRIFDPELNETFNSKRKINGKSN